VMHHPRGGSGGSGSNSSSSGTTSDAINDDASSNTHRRRSMIQPRRGHVPRATSGVGSLQAKSRASARYTCKQTQQLADEHHDMDEPRRSNASKSRGGATCGQGGDRASEANTHSNVMQKSRTCKEAQARCWLHRKVCHVSPFSSEDCVSRDDLCCSMVWFAGVTDGCVSSCMPSCMPLFGWCSVGHLPPLGGRWPSTRPWPRSDRCHA
jgi:hypothetical protein